LVVAASAPRSQDAVVRSRPTVDAAKLRELSVKASCDPRTLSKLLAGRPVRGLAGYRAADALRAAGFTVPADIQTRDAR